MGFENRISLLFARILKWENYVRVSEKIFYLYDPEIEREDIYTNIPNKNVTTEIFDGDFVELYKSMIDYYWSIK